MFDWLFKSKESEIITTSVNYYDSPADLELYWDDVLEVLSLVKVSSEKSVMELKRKFNLQNKYGNDLYVTLTTPKKDDFHPTSDRYPGDSWDFTVEDVQKIYNEELEKRKKDAEWEKEKRERDKIHQEQNTTESLMKDLKRLNAKKRFK